MNRRQLMQTGLAGFASWQRLKVGKDAADDTEVILGRTGQIYYYSDDELGVMFIPKGKPKTRQWRSFRQKCVAAGMVLRQNGNAEGALSFTQENETQAKLAIKVAGAKRKRKLSPEHRARLLEASPIVAANASRPILNKVSGC
jgi:hypothetical protein